MLAGATLSFAISRNTSAVVYDYSRENIVHKISNNSGFSGAHISWKLRVTVFPSFDSSGTSNGSKVLPRRIEVQVVSPNVEIDRSRRHRRRTISVNRRTLHLGVLHLTPLDAQSRYRRLYFLPLIV